MSDLKHKTVDELHLDKQICENYIAVLKSKLNGQQVRLEWINKYLFEKTPQELTFAQVEARLGHRLILK